MQNREQSEIFKEHLKREKSKRNLQTSILLSLAVTTILFAAGLNKTFPSDIAYIPSIIAGTTTFVLAIYYYLQTRPIYIPNPHTERTPLQELRSARSSLDEIENLLSIYIDTKSTTQSAEIKKLRDRIRESYEEICYEWYSPRSMLDLDEDLLNSSTGISIIRSSIDSTRAHISDLITQELEDKTVEHRESERKIERTRLLGERAHSRLTIEISQLSRRANVYISIGTAITFVAGYFLYLAAQDSYESISSLTSTDPTQLIQPKFLATVIIKISIVVFIEIFAFYFLKLHKDLMENIKYYQNEITNIDLKIAGLSAAENSDECIKIAVEELLKTERNFLIKDKHTTIELERRKQDSSFTADLAETILKLIKSKEK